MMYTSPSLGQKKLQEVRFNLCKSRRDCARASWPPVAELQKVAKTGLARGLTEPQTMRTATGGRFKLVGQETREAGYITTNTV